jgi:heterodisulfide reductase subunit C
MLNNIEIKEVYKTIKESAIKANKEAVKTTADVKKEVKEVSKPWIKLGKKAWKGGVKMAEAQQEIAVEAIKEVKGQLKESADRFQKIVKK